MPAGPAYGAAHGAAAGRRGRRGGAGAGRGRGRTCSGNGVAGTARSGARSVLNQRPTVSNVRRQRQLRRTK